MSTWRDVLLELACDAEARFDALRYALRDALGGPGPVKIVAYRGYGTRSGVRVGGRVLEDPGITEGAENDTLWTNLVNTWRRLETDEVPHARVRVRVGDAEREALADDEGYFEVELAPSTPLPLAQALHPVQLELLSPRAAGQTVRALAEALVPSASARFVVISDLDDTVVHTDLANLTRAARELFLGNAHTRLPFPGVAAFYRALCASEGDAGENPLVYVSRSPWNLYDLLDQFLRLHGLPVGPLLLRDWGLSAEGLRPASSRGHKYVAIRRVLDTWPDLPAILIGDSGQRDPEIYRELVRELPGRVLAVYIRDVCRDPARTAAIQALSDEVAAAGSCLVLAPDTVAMARHAASRGWIAAGSLPAIQSERDADAGPAGRLEQLLGETAPDHATSSRQGEG